MIRKLGYKEMQFLGNGFLLRLYNKTLLKRHALQVGLDVASVVMSFYLSALLISYISIKEVTHLPDLFAMITISTIQLIVLYAGGLHRIDNRLLAVGDFIRITKNLLAAVFFRCRCLSSFHLSAGGTCISSQP